MCHFLILRVIYVAQAVIKQGPTVTEHPMEAVIFTKYIKHSQRRASVVFFAMADGKLLIG